MAVRDKLCIENGEISSAARRKILCKRIVSLPAVIAGFMHLTSMHFGYDPHHVGLVGNPLKRDLAKNQWGKPITSGDCVMLVVFCAFHHLDQQTSTKGGTVGFNPTHLFFPRVFSLESAIFTPVSGVGIAFGELGVCSSLTTRLFSLSGIQAALVGRIIKEK